MRKKTEISNKKSCDGVVSYRPLYQDGRLISPVFSVERKGAVKKTEVFLRDHFYILIKSAAENHLRIQQSKKKLAEGENCSLSFGSYTQLKKYQKKVRILTFSTSSTMASVMIVMLMMQILSPVITHGATFYFDQTGWSASPTGAYAKHPPVNFTDYEGKDANIEILSPGSNSSIALAETVAPASKAETSSAQFGAGIGNGTGVAGEGDEAFVFPCQFDHGGSSWEPTNGDTWDLEPSGAIAIAGTHCNISNFTIASGKTVFVKGYDGTSYGKISIYAGNSTITGALSATGSGYAGGGITAATANGQGPGGGKYVVTTGGRGFGGGYGGKGGIGYQASDLSLRGGVYGSFVAPTDMGSGAAANVYNAVKGGSGGGAINMSINGTLNIVGSIDANGSYLANGTGGSGGSVWLNAESVLGSGLITANGPSALMGGAGGGGRIAINYKTSVVPTRQAFGGYGTYVTEGAGAGTIYLKKSTQANGDLFVSNNNLNNSQETELFTALTTPANPQSVQLNSLTVTKQAKLVNVVDVVANDLIVDDNSSLTADGSVTASNSINGQAGGANHDYTLTSGVIKAGGAGTVNFPSSIDNLTLNNYTLQLKSIAAGTITVGSGSVLTHPQNNTVGLTINATSVDVQSGGSIDVSGKGYLAGSKNQNGTGPGAGSFNGSYSSAASYGGKGATAIGASGSVYGSVKEPNQMGSGGGVGNMTDYETIEAGGGLLRLTASTLTLNGSIRSDASVPANGQSGSSGGSIWISAGAISSAGSGIIAAGGGSVLSMYSANGGGGRVAIDGYTSMNLPLDNISAVGGASGSHDTAGAGTVYLKGAAQTEGELIVNNKDSVIGSHSITPLVDTVSVFDKVIIKGKANLSVPTGKTLTASNLNIEKNGTFTSVVSNAADATTSNFAVTGTFTLGDGTNATSLSINNAARNLKLTGANVLIKNLATLTHDQNSSAKTSYINWSVNNLTVDSGGRIDVAGKGYGGNYGFTTSTKGQGTAAGSGGGAHYGAGGAGSTGAAGAADGDNINAPNNLGSAGGTISGGSGGGYVKILAAATIINGTINANGNSGANNYGAGAGGSIWLAASGDFGGTTGVITADGGAGLGTGGGGGGGIVTITHATTSYVGTTPTSNGGTGNSGAGNASAGSVIAFVQANYYAENGEQKSQKLVFIAKNKKTLAQNIRNFFGIYSVSAATGDFTSESIDTGYSTAYFGISFATINFSADSGVTLQIATNNDNSTWNFVGPDGTAATYYTSTGTAINAAHNNSKYLKYKAYFNYTSTEPHLNDVTFNYAAQKYQTNQSLTSSWYNTMDGANFLTGILWDENAAMPQDTAVRFQVQTALNDDNGTPENANDDIPGVATGFTGPDGTDATYFSNTDSHCAKTGTEVLCSVPNINVGDGMDDQWIKYKVFLDSAGMYTPQIDRIKMQYVVNFTPQITNVSAVQDEAGMVNISYDLRDDDSSNFDVYFAADLGVTLKDNPLPIDAVTIKLNGGYNNLPTGNQTIQINQEQLSCASRVGDTLSSCLRGRNNSRPSVQPQSAKVYFVANSVNTTGTGAGLVQGIGKMGTWDIKKDLNEIYEAGAAIKVVANDGTLANQVSFEAGATAGLVIDTKNPVFKSNNALTINRIKNELTINKQDIGNVMDDTNFDLYIKDVKGGQPCNITEADKQENLPAVTTFPRIVAHTIANSSFDPVKVCVKTKDAKGNIGEASVTTPISPVDVKFYDFSQLTEDSASSVFTELIVWNVYEGADFSKYELYRASKPKAWVEANPAGVPTPDEFKKIDDPGATSTNPQSNFYFDKFTDSDAPSKDSLRNLDTYFFYKVVVTDNVNNVTALSSPRVTDIADGQGGTDTKAPALNVSIVDKSATWAQLSVVADEISSAVVYYSTDDSYDKNTADPSFIRDHGITINGLNKNTTYNAKIVVTDPANNSTEKIVAFTTADGSQISNVTFDKNSNVEATIFWATDTNSTSKVEYSSVKNTDGTALVNPVIEEDTNLTNTHRINIKNLTQGVRYYFSVSSTDKDDLSTIDKNGGLFHSILTTIDDNAPIISDVDSPFNSYNSAAIQWVTNIQPTVGKVMYRKSSEPTFVSTDESYTYDSSHYVVIPGLKADTEYTYKIFAKNLNGKSSTSPEQIFKTAKDPSFDHAALTEIIFSDPNPSVLTDTDAVISFASDQLASCYLEYGVSTGSYGAVPEKEEVGLFNKNHNIHLLGLIFQTNYFYKVTCQDNLGNVISSEEKDFTTKEKQYTAAGIGDLLDRVPPVISNVNVAAITGESAIITWDTDEQGSSSVKFGTGAVFTDIAGDVNVNSDSKNYVVTHTVNLSGLIPATGYVFVASSNDASGNISQSAESSFNTASPSSLSSIKVESKNLGEAVITWKTDQETTSTVEYGLTTSYGEKKENNSLATDHAISLSNLNQGTTYHYRVKGKDTSGRLFASADNTFEPKSPAQITDILVNDVTEHGAKISFKTNIPTDAEVTYTDIKDNQATGSQGIRDLSTEHKVMLTNLKQGTTFAITISAKDEQGTEATIKAPDLTTGQDEQSPRIENIKTDSALTQSDKVQTIISWKTDEQATTSILYKEGRDGEEKELKITDNLTTGHVSVITIFKPGMVYNFKVKSVDFSGNVAISTDFALLTPKKRENIIQIIIGNFTDIFGWAKF